MAVAIMTSKEQPNTAMAAAMLAAAGNDDPTEIAEKSAVEGERVIAANAVKAAGKPVTQENIDAELEHRKRSAAGKKAAATRKHKQAEVKAAAKAEADAAAKAKADAKAAKLRQTQAAIRAELEEQVRRTLAMDLVDELKTALRENVSLEVIREICRRCDIKRVERGWAQFNIGIVTKSNWASRIQEAGYAEVFSFADPESLPAHSCPAKPKPQCKPAGGIDFVGQAEALNADLHAAIANNDDPALKIAINAIAAQAAQVQQVAEQFGQAELFSFPQQSLAEVVAQRKLVLSKPTSEDVLKLVQTGTWVAKEANKFAGNGNVDLTRAHHVTPLMKAVKVLGLTAAGFDLSGKGLPIQGVAAGSDAAKAIEHCFGCIKSDDRVLATAAQGLVDKLKFIADAD